MMTKVFPSSLLAWMLCVGLLGTIFSLGQSKSVSGSAPWAMVNGGFDSSYHNRLVLVDTSLFAANHLGLFVTSTRSEAWKRVRSGIPERPHFFAFAVGNGFVLAGDFLKGMFRSTNGGMDWVKVDSTQAYEAISIHGQTVLAGGNRGTMRSTDGGKTWNRIFLDDRVLGAYSMTYAGGRFLAGGYGAVNSSVDDGITWKSTPVGGPGVDLFRAIAASGTTVRYAGGSSGLYVARNPDTSWTRVEGLFKNAQVVTLMIEGNNVLVGTDSGIVISNDLGANWRRFDEGLPRHWVESFALVGGTLYAGVQGKGIWRIPWSAALATEPGRPGPRFRWVQGRQDRNLNLEINLPEAGRPGLSLSNISGRQILRKDFGLMPAGRSLFTLDLDLPGGTYLVELRAGKTKQSKVMVVR